MNRLPFETAMSAASLRRFSRSTPEKPGMPRAMELRSTSSPGLAPRVYAQYSLPAPDIRQTEYTLLVEAARAGQCIVQDIVAVRGRHDDDPLVVAEAVHLDEQLVQSPLSLVVSAAEARPR